jgi:uracil phosphoribosyltransferase
MVNVSLHPLVMDKIAKLRNKDTPVADFKKTMKELGMLLAYEVTSTFQTKEVRVKTPLGTAMCKVIAKDIIVVAILRAGLGLVEGLMEIIPNAKQAHIGIYRDEETLKPVKYYLRFPSSLENSYVIIADPMLATGGSAIEAVNIVKSRGAKNIYFLSVISSKLGIKLLKKHHPDVKIYTGAVDEKLNDNGYIVPGLGDAGDRMFGTF